MLEACGNQMFAALAPVAEPLSGGTFEQLMPTRPSVAATGLHSDVAQAVAGGPLAARAAMGDTLEQGRDATGPAFH